MWNWRQKKKKKVENRAIPISTAPRKLGVSKAPFCICLSSLKLLGWLLRESK